MHDDEEDIDDKENIDVPTRVRETAREKRFLASVPPLPFVPSLHDHSRASGVFRSLEEERCAEEAAATSALAACPGLALWLETVLPPKSPDVHTTPHLLTGGALVAVVALHLDGFVSHSTADAAALFSCVKKMALMVPTDSSLNSSERRGSREHRVRRRNWELLRRGFVAAQRGFLLTASDVSALVSCDDVACVGLGAAVLARLFEYATATGLTASSGPSEDIPVDPLVAKNTSVAVVTDDSTQPSMDDAMLAGAATFDQAAPNISANKLAPRRNHWAIVRRSLARIAPHQASSPSETNNSSSENVVPSTPRSDPTQEVPVEASAAGFDDLSSASSSSCTLSAFHTEESLKPVGLPPGKRFHFFVSHKKWHSSLGCSAEALAVLLKSVLEERGFVGCLDLDDICEITSASFREKVASSVCMLALLNDETAQSKWCVEEWKLAQQYGVPVVAIFNQDEQSLREIRDVISKLSSGAAFDHNGIRDNNSAENSAEGSSSGSGGSGSGMPFLFEHQTVPFTSGHRRTCFNNLCERLNKFTKLATPQRPCFTRLAACEEACAAALADLPTPLADALRLSGSDNRSDDQHGSGSNQSSSRASGDSNGGDHQNSCPITDGGGSIFFTARCQARFNVLLQARNRRHRLNHIHPTDSDAPPSEATNTFEDAAVEGEIWPWTDVTPAVVLDLLSPLPNGCRGPPSDNHSTESPESNYSGYSSRSASSLPLPLSVAAAAQDAANSLKNAHEVDQHRQQQEPRGEDVDASAYSQQRGHHSNDRCCGSRAIAVCAALLRAVLRALGPPAAGGGGLDAHGFARFCCVILVEALTRGTPFALAAAIRADNDNDDGNDGDNATSLSLAAAATGDGAAGVVSVQDDDVTFGALNGRHARHNGRSPPPRSNARPRTPPPPSTARPGLTPPRSRLPPKEAAAVKDNGTEEVSSCVGACAALSALPAFAPPLSPAVLCGPKSLRPYLLAATSLHAHLPADFQLALLSTAATVPAFPAQLLATQSNHHSDSGAAALTPAAVAIKAAQAAAGDGNNSPPSGAGTRSNCTGLFGKCAGNVFYELDTNHDGQLSLGEVAILLAHPMASRGFNWPSSGAGPPVSAANAELFVRAFRELSNNNSANGASNSENAVGGRGGGGNMSSSVTPGSMQLGSPRGKRCSSMLQAGQVQSQNTSSRNAMQMSSYLSQERGEVVVKFSELEEMLRLTVLLQALCSLNRGWLQQTSAGR